MVKNYSQKERRKTLKLTADIGPAAAVRRLGFNKNTLRDRRNHQKRLILNSAVHFLVDLSCAALLLGRICSDWNPAVAILIYNFFAFAVQMPLGALADSLGHTERFTAGGCILVLSGWLLQPGLWAVVLAGLGNAAFHVGAGLDTLNTWGNRAGPLGFFVSPGAFGIWLGGILAGEVPGWLFKVALFVAATLLLAFGKGPENVPLALPKCGICFWTAVPALLLVVVIRSFLGLSAQLPWKAELGFLSVCAVAFGKAAGGFLADQFGFRPVSVASLGLAALCFMWGNNAIMGLLALFLFNMTMPLTLWTAARFMSGLRGFSFGLLTFGLFLGFLPVYLGAPGLESWALSLLSALSLPPLLWGVYVAERGNVSDS